MWCRDFISVIPLVNLLTVIFLLYCNLAFASRQPNTTPRNTRWACKTYFLMWANRFDVLISCLIPLISHQSARGMPRNINEKIPLREWQFRVWVSEGNQHVLEASYKLAPSTMSAAILEACNDFFGKTRTSVGLLQSLIFFYFDTPTVCRSLATKLTDHSRCGARGWNVSSQLLSASSAISFGCKGVAYLIKRDFLINGALGHLPLSRKHIWTPPTQEPEHWRMNLTHVLSLNSVVINEMRAYVCDYWVLSATLHLFELERSDILR